MDKRVEKSEKGNNLGWTCVLVLESLIPVVVDPVIRKSRLLVNERESESESESESYWRARRLGEQRV